MIETREDFAQINAALADTVPDEHEELLDLIEALREVARLGRNWSHATKNISTYELKLMDAIDALPEWITEE